jgi:hypothetical protein
MIVAGSIRHGRFENLGVGIAEAEEAVACGIGVKDSD